jgi:orotate phosphoribosyltransferase
MVDLSLDIAKAGLSIGAIKLSPASPFQWASGYFMPIYNDNRMFLFHPAHRATIKQAFLAIAESESLKFDVIGGTSTAGIPWAAFFADALDKPMIYIRDKPKDHGLKNQIEGIDANAGLEGARVIVIEDLISTGGSSVAAVQAVRNAGGMVEACISIFNYGLDKAVQEFEALDPPCRVLSLLTYDTLLQAAIETNYLEQDQVDVLQEWRANPFNWGENHGFPKVEK